MQFPIPKRHTGESQLDMLNHFLHPPLPPQYPFVRERNFRRETGGTILTTEEGEIPNWFRSNYGQHKFDEFDICTIGEIQRHARVVEDIVHWSGGGGE